MKKLLIFCLILLCTLSVFAADVSAQVKLYFSYGSDGFGFSSNKGWEPVMTMSVRGDKAGASFSWCPIDLQNSNYGFNVWILPCDDSSKFLLTTGSNFSVNFVEDFTFNNFMAYGVVGYIESGYRYYDGYNWVPYWDLSSVSLSTSGVVTQLGFGYQPESVSDFSNADVFIAGYFNYLNKEIGLFHFDGLTKLNVENNKPSLDYSLSEVSFNRFAVSGNCVENANTDRIVAITEKFNFDEAYYFDHESRSREHDSWCKSTFNAGFVAGIRYKYFTDADKTVYNGLYGYGLGSYLLKDNESTTNVSFEAETEIGRYNAELEIESRGTVYNTPEKFYSQYTFDWTDGKLDASITDISLYLSRDITIMKREDGLSFGLYMQSNYKNLSTNTADENGFFINPGFTTSVGSCNIDAGAIVGFDSLKNFKWNAQSSFVVNF